MSEDELATARMDDDGAGSAITSSPDERWLDYLAATVPDRLQDYQLTN
jgi:hypothetical protein